MKKSIFSGILSIPGAVVGIFNEDLGRIIDTPFSFGGELFLSNYSRGQENESDKLGVKLASEAGYDPAKLAIILERLSRDVELITGEAEKRSYFSSHPFTPKRVEKIEKEIAKLEWTEREAIANSRQELYSKIDGMVYGENPAHGIFEENMFKHFDLGLAITFPKDWKTINVPIAVGAQQPDGEAQLVFMVDTSSSEPDSLGTKFANYLKTKYDLKPDRSESLEINGFPAYVVSLKDVSGQQPVEIQIYWLKTDNTLFNVFGVSLLKHSESISNTIASFRKLTDDEKHNINELKIRVATSEQNELIEDFVNRTNNKWNLETTSLKNGLNDKDVLQEEQVLKIVVREPYLPK